MDYGRIIFLLWAALALYWIVSAASAKTTTYRSKGGWLYSGLGVVLVLGAIYSVFPHLLRGRFVPPGASVLALGTALTALGIAIAIWARIFLGRNWSATPTIKEQHELIQTGPYRLVRHPIYTGLLLAILGTCLAKGQARDLVFLIAITIVLAFKLRAEEALMLRQFPEAYPEYRRRTKALIPFVL
jgi:protein-S-isoprenylcysteine O-methyltransferase Ste14